MFGRIRGMERDMDIDDAKQTTGEQAVDLLIVALLTVLMFLVATYILAAIGVMPEDIRPVIGE